MSLGKAILGNLTFLRRVFTNLMVFMPFWHPFGGNNGGSD